jgi:hypothetical protein
MAKSKIIPERHMVILQDPDETFRALYWVIRGKVLSMSVRVLNVEEGFYEFREGLYITKTGYLASLFISNISRTILIKHPRSKMFVRYANMINFVFPDHGELKLLSKGFLKTENSYHAR